MKTIIDGKVYTNNVSESVDDNFRTHEQFQQMLSDHFNEFTNPNNLQGAELFLAVYDHIQSKFLIIGIEDCDSCSVVTLPKSRTITNEILQLYSKSFSVFISNSNLCIMVRLLDQDGVEMFNRPFSSQHKTIKL
jgi:hypothetical protein